MKLPNNFGSVVRLSGNRRRPFIARKTLYYNEKGHPVYDIIGYYASYPEGIEALIKHNNQISISAPGESLASLYKRWFPLQLSRVGRSAIEGYKNAFHHLRPLSSKPLQTLKFTEIQNCFNQMKTSDGVLVGYSTKKKVRTLIRLLLKYGRTHELCAIADFTHDIDLGDNSPVKPHTRFTTRQINKVWRSSIEEKDIVLILLYTGMRIGELINLKKKEVKLKRKYFNITSSKTESGIRIIPIHDAIFPIVIKLMDQPGNYLLPYRTYAKASARFSIAMKKMHMKHTSHDCRHTVRSILNERDGNQAAIDRLLGHRSQSIGDAVYTHVRLPQLRRTIKLLPPPCY